MSTRVLLLLAIAALQGCTGTVAYKPEYLGDPPAFYGKPVEGRALLYMTPQDRNYVFTGSPNTFAGSATSATLPLGLYVQQVGKEALGRFYSGGVALVEDLTDVRQESTVGVHVENFSYGYDVLGNYAVVIDMELVVALLDQESRALWSNVYRADGNRVQAKCPATQPQECVNKAVHVTHYDLMYKAGSGLRSYRYSQGQ